LTTAAMTHAASFDSNWNFTSVWTTENDTTTPLLLANLPAGSMPVTPPSGSTLPITDEITPLGQHLATFESELTSTQDLFAANPFNGLNTIALLQNVTPIRLGGDLLGAIDNEVPLDAIAYASSTSGLPALSRLVTPDTGIVTVTAGTVQAGNPQTGEPVYLDTPGYGGLPSDAVLRLRAVLSAPVYNQLRPLIYDRY